MFKLQIETGNAAFAEGLADELATVLRNVADRIEAGEFNGKVRDSNGNTVGQFETAAQ